MTLKHALTEFFIGLAADLVLFDATCHRVIAVYIGYLIGDLDPRATL